MQTLLVSAETASLIEKNKKVWGFFGGGDLFLVAFYKCLCSGPISEAVWAQSTNQPRLQRLAELDMPGVELTHLEETEL